MPHHIRTLPRRKDRAPLSRSQMMARIGSKDTRPEVRTRSSAHALGVRFRIHVSDLPGKPDLANKSRKWAIFVHGCFWHSHGGCKLASAPKSNTGYWGSKLERNRVRDAENLNRLRALGYRVLIVWECDTRDETRLDAAVAAFFSSLRPEL